MKETTSVKENDDERRSSLSSRASISPINRIDAFSIVGIREYFTDREPIDLNLPDIRENTPQKNYLGSTICETFQLNSSWLIKVFRFLIFYSVGVLVYYHVEGWTGLDCVYFITQTISTVGYGNIAPITITGRLFTIFYIYCGILLVFSVINDIAVAMVDFFRNKYKKSLKKSKLQITVRHTLNTLMWVLVLVIVLSIGGLVFSYNEGIPFIHGLYFAAVTTTTVGFGDYTLIKRSSIYFNIVYILICVTITALALQKISLLPQKIENTEMRGLLDAIEPSPELLIAIRGSSKSDRRGSSFTTSSLHNLESGIQFDVTEQPMLKISKAEYILHMLQLAGKIDRNYDMLKWMDRFEEFDIDHDGYLTLHDVNTYTLQKHNMKNEPKQEVLYSKGWIRKVFEEIIDVILETFRLKDVTGDDVIINTNISSPIHERIASANYLSSAAIAATRRSGKFENHNDTNDSQHDLELTLQRNKQYMNESSSMEGMEASMESISSNYDETPSS